LNSFKNLSIERCTSKEPIGDQLVHDWPYSSDESAFSRSDQKPERTDDWQAQARRRAATRQIVYYDKVRDKVRGKMKCERNRFPLASVEIACEIWKLRSLLSANPRGEVAHRRRDF
jgi:hypothetical protein